MRIRAAGQRAFLTIKSREPGLSRQEFEYPVPIADAEALMALAETSLEKTRHHVRHAGALWEVDVFHGANEGLVLAEIELASEDAPVRVPSWAGREVTGDPRFFSAYLARHPFRTWRDG